MEIYTENRLIGYLITWNLDRKAGRLCGFRYGWLRIGGPCLLIHSNPQYSSPLTYILTSRTSSMGASP